MMISSLSLCILCMAVAVAFHVVEGFVVPKRSVHLIQRQQPRSFVEMPDENSILSSSSCLAMGLFDWNQNGNNSSNGQNHDVVGKKRQQKYQMGEGKTWSRENGKRVYRGMSKTEEAKKKKNTYQGDRITIRQDEDAAMWTDDEDAAGKKKKGWFG